MLTYLPPYLVPYYEIMQNDVRHRDPTVFATMKAIVTEVIRLELLKVSEMIYDLTHEDLFELLSNKKVDLLYRSKHQIHLVKHFSLLIQQLSKTESPSQMWDDDIFKSCYHSLFEFIQLHYQDGVDQGNPQDAAQSYDEIFNNLFAFDGASNKDLNRLLLTQQMDELTATIRRVEKEQFELERTLQEKLLQHNTQQDLVNKKKLLDNEIGQLSKRQTEIEQSDNSLLDEIRILKDEKRTAALLVHSNYINELSEIDEQLDHKQRQLQDIQDQLLIDQESTLKTTYTVLINECKDRIKTYQNKLLELNQSLTIQDEHKSAAYFEDLSILQTPFSVLETYNKQTSYSILNTLQIKNAESENDSYFAMIYNLLTKGRNINPSAFLKSFNLNPTELTLVHAFQISMLVVQQSGQFHSMHWTISIAHSSYGYLLNYAFNDLMIRFTNLLTLCDKNPSFKPTLTIGHDGIPLSFAKWMDGQGIAIDLISREKHHKIAPLKITDKINYVVDSVNTNHKRILEELLTEVFQFQNFRDGQFEILANFLNGHNTVGILPTGAGKSMIFYMAIILQPKIALIISPILALINDQIYKLHDIFGFNRIIGLTSETQNKMELMKQFGSSDVQFTFIAPERTQDIRFREQLIRLHYKQNIGSIILDEVHCLSEWGHDFRVSYLMLSHTLHTYCPNISFLGLTATASVNVITDIRAELKIQKNSDIIFSKKLKRDNLNFQIKRVNSADEAINEIQRTLALGTIKESIYDIKQNSSASNCGIIFSQTKNGKIVGVEPLYNLFYDKYGDRVGLYHGSNKEDQIDFMANKKTLLIATKAFGMGVDKPNVRFTIHLGIPSSRESYYQEAGRAGRDNGYSECLLYSFTPKVNENHPIARFLKLDTSVREMIDIQKNALKFSPYDISTQFFFMIQGLEDPHDEVNNLLVIYQKIKNLIDQDKYEYEIECESKEKAYNEKYYYYLHKMGIINNWSIQYSNTIKLKYEIHKHAVDINHLKETSIRYISMYQPDTKIIDEIRYIKSIHQMRELFTIVRSWYYNVFIIGRRAKLQGMYDFLNKHADAHSDSDTIQQELSDFFDLSQALPEDGSDFGDFSEGVTFADIVKRAFEIPQKELALKQINTESLLESIVNQKLNILSGLIYLRNDEWMISKNGQERFSFALSQMNAHEVRQLFEEVMVHYDSLTDNQKIQLISAIIEKVPHYEVKYLDNQKNDLVANMWALMKINDGINSYFGGNEYGTKAS